MLLSLVLAFQASALNPPSRLGDPASPSSTAGETLLSLSLPRPERLDIPTTLSPSQASRLAEDLVSKQAQPGLQELKRQPHLWKLSGG